jgi:HJR/Mrr/RecB family endonuclease
MGIINRLFRQALDNQKKEFEEYYKAEDEYIRKVKIELHGRLEKSKEYRIALCEYRDKLMERESKIEEKELALKAKEDSLMEDVGKAVANREARVNEKERALKAKEKTLRADITKEVMKNLEKEKAEFEKQRAQWIEYEKDLRRTEYTLLDWFKRLDRKEREIFDEILSDVNKYKEYSKNTPQMDGFQFEQYVAGLLMRNGYTNVIVTQKSGDYGADITAERQEVKYVIQCKYYSSQVGIEAVQQIYAAKIHYNANVAVVATNSVYTRAAETLAKDLGVVLWEGKELNDMFGANLS